MGSRTLSAADFGFALQDNPTRRLSMRQHASMRPNRTRKAHTLKILLNHGPLLYDCRQEMSAVGDGIARNNEWISLAVENFRPLHTH